MQLGRVARLLPLKRLSSPELATLHRLHAYGRALLLDAQRLAQLLHLGIRCAEEELERLDLLARGVRLALRRLELLRES